MNDKERAHRGYKERRQRRDERALGPEPQLPTEMTAAGLAMEVELEHRRVMARKDALRKARLKPYKLLSVRFQGGEVR